MFLSLSLLIAPAHAKCKAPQPVFSAQGQVVPEDPSLFFFRPGSDRVEVAFTARDARGTPLAVDARRAPAAPGVDVWSLTVDTDGPGAIVLTADWKSAHGTQRTVDGTTEVVADWAPTHADAAVLTDVGTTRSQWTCSHQESRDLNIVAPGATALQIEWAGNASELARGEVQRVVLPDHPDRFWGDTDVAGQRAELGFLDCFGETFEWRRAAVWMTVQPLYADGTVGDASEPHFVRRP